MACQAMHMWSLSGLVAAFVDLSIAYLLLCGSSIAFLASKFLGFFGLNLPCPCDGLFLNIPSKEYCLSRLLVDIPTEKVSSVHLSVKHKFPFNDSVWGRTHSYGVLENDYVNRIPQIEGEGSCCSVSDAKMSRSVVLKELSDRDEKYDLNGKRVSDHRPRSRLRLRRRGGGGRGRHSSVSSYDSSVNGGWEPYSHSHQLEYNEKASTVMGVSQRSLSSVEINLSPNEDMHMKHATSTEELQDNQHGIENFSEDEKDTIKLLEQKLDEERVARAALYIELEKERSAAASAADEAMAMILRLQEEKAAIEMEARQSQRIVNEKSAYDAEEMNILKEILVRREMEKHFLEKEVEAYRQMVSLGNEQLGGNDSNNNDVGRLFDLMLDPDDDPIMMLHQLNASNEKKVITESSCSDGVGKLQEKEMISADNNSYLTSNVPEECEFLQNTTPVKEKEVEQIEKTNGDHELSEKIIVTCNGTETSSNYGLNLEQESSSNNSCGGMFDKDSHVHDVHVIGDQTDLYRSSSDITRGLPPMGPKGKSLSDLRRSSMSAVDSEMLKIDCEVGKLRERLKIVQEGREKLSFSVESRERESMQLKLLEDISRQVQEIRDLTEPGKAARQASFPLPNSKVLSKRRRCRSVSSGPQRNSRGSNASYET